MLQCAAAAAVRNSDVIMHAVTPAVEAGPDMCALFTMPCIALNAGRAGKDLHNSRNIIIMDFRKQLSFGHVVLCLSLLSARKF